MLQQYPSLNQAVEYAKRETRSAQARRLVDFLLANPGALTAKVGSECAIGNLSSAAAKIRPQLERRGWTIQAELPPQKVANRFGESTMMHRWSLVRIAEVGGR